MPVLHDSTGEGIVWAGVHETIDDLGRNGYKVIQSRTGYRFSMDSVLLSHFAEIKENDTVLDLGCGNGVVSILIAARQPQCTIVGVEVQEQLAERARRSVRLNRLDSRIEIITADLKEVHMILGERKFSVVVANPPFWKQGEGRLSRDEERRIARHEIKASLYDYVNAAAGVLEHGGRLVLVQRAARFAEACALCLAAGLGVKRVRFVHPRQDEEANLVLLEVVKEYQGGDVMLPPLVVYRQDGGYTEEINQIYFV